MNKYLEKVASFESFAKDFNKGFRRSSTTSKIGLGMSAAGLSLGVANYVNSVENKHRGRHMADVESQSLNELKGISEALKKRQNVNVHVKLPQEKTASLKNAVKDALRFSQAHPLPVIGGTLGAIDGAGQTTKQPGESSFKTGLRGIRNTVTGAVAGAGIGALGEQAYNKYIRK